MRNIRLLAINAADEATLTVSPAVVSTLPVGNLKLTARAKVMRTTSTVTQQINGAWSTPRAMSCCVLWRHNLSNVGTWRLEVFTDAAWTDLAYDSGAALACLPKPLDKLLWGVEPLGASWYHDWDYGNAAMFFTRVIGKSFRITLSDADNPAGYMQASRLMLGDALEPAYNISYGLRLAWRDESQRSRTDGGTLRTNAAEPYRVLRCDLNFMGEDDRQQFLEVSRAVGRRTDMFVSCFPATGTAAERDYMFACRAAADAEQTHPMYGRFALPLDLEEI